MKKHLLMLLLVPIGCATPSSPEKPYSGHGAASVTKDVLAKYAPPPLPPEDAEKIRKYWELQPPGVGMLSPNGKTLFFGWSITGTNQVYRLDRPLDFPVQMTSGADRVSLADVLQDGKYVIVERDRAGEENPGLYLLPTAGGPLIEIQHKKAVRTRYAWSTLDGKTIYFMANDVAPDSYALYSYDVATKKKETLLSEPGLWFVADVAISRGEVLFLIGKSTGALTAEFYRFSLSDKKLVPVLGQNEKAEYFATFGAIAGELFVRTNKFDEFYRLYRYREGKFDPITPELKMDVDSFFMPFNNSVLYVHYNDNGATRLEVRDPNTYKIKPMPKFPEDAAHVFATSPTRMGRFVAIGIEKSKEPRVSYVFDWRSNKLTQWVRPSFPELERSTFADTVLETYPARDGVPIPMLVTRPKGCETKACPVIVHFHGGPEAQSRPGFNRRAQLLVSEGFVVVEPNVRGSEGYGKAWLSADDGAKRLNVITDIEDCATHLRSAWARDGKAPRIGVMGWSYGGYSTLMAMSRFAGAYDAGVAIVGMSDLRSFLANTAPYRRLLRTSEYGDLEKDHDALTQLSPITYIDKVKSPLMLIQGASDPRVPVGEALQVHRALSKRGIEAPLIIFADEGHGTAKRDNSVLEIGHAMAFMKKHLN